MLLKILKCIIYCLYRVKVSGYYAGGKANGQQKTLVIANHSSFIDGILLMLFLPEKPVFVIHEDSENSPFFRFFLRFSEYLTVDSANPIAMRSVIRLLDAGRTVVIFPEGRVTVTGSLMKLYSGAAFAALKTQATIIPVQINGAQYSYFSQLKHILTWRLFPKVRITIFPPTALDLPEEADEEKRRTLAKAQMHDIMTNMAVESRERMTLFNMLLSVKSIHGGKRLAIKDALGERATFSEVVQKSVALSVIFSRKLNLSQRVGVMLPNSNAVCLVFYALQHQAKTPVMVNYTAGSRAIIAGLIASQTHTILTSRRFIDKAELHGLIDALSDYEIIYLEDLRKTVTLADKLLILLKCQFPKATSVKQKPTDEAVVLFTSGTEGLPKGVVHCHDALLTNVAQVRALYDFNTQDKFMLCLPTFHVFGLTGGLVLPLVAGSATFFYPSPLHYRVIPNLIYEENCTVLLSTSTFLDGYARFAESFDLRSIRYIIAGAEKLSPEVVKTYHEKFGIRIMEGYGATETAPVIAANSPMSHRRSAVGMLLPSMTMDIVPVAGIKRGGELVVCGDNVMLGYLRPDNPGVIEYTPTVNNQRQYATGDIAEIDDEGFIHLRGRVKRFAKIAGEMISLDSVEKMAIHASPNGYHAAININDKRKGEAIILFSTDPELTRRSLQQSAKQLGFAKLAVPKTIEAIDEIPVFANGKTNYPALVEKLQTAEK